MLMFKILGIGWIRQGWRNVKKPGGYKNGDVDQHGLLSPGANRASGHHNIKPDDFIQSHHPIQDAWAKRRINGYKRNKALGILLPSSSGMSHANISLAQRLRRSANGGWNTTLRDEFNIGYREMLNAGVPTKQAQKAFKQAYKYFDNLRNQNLNNPFFNIQESNMNQILGIKLPPIYEKFLNKIELGNIFSVDGTGIDFYSISDLEERNITYDIQKEEPRFLLIGQDGDLGFFIKDGQDDIYSNDLGAIGSLEMDRISDNINNFIEYAKENYDDL